MFGLDYSVSRDGLGLGLGLECDYSSVSRDVRLLWISESLFDGETSVL